LSRFALVAIAAAVATFVLIAAGGLVRATDSGLGCPDWPLCFGEWVPPPELHAWIEHTHRLIAAFAVGPLVAVVGILTIVSRSRRSDRVLLGAAIAAGVLVIAQSLLGALVVAERLRAELVTLHLGMALTVFAATIVIAERALRGSFPVRPTAPVLTRITAVTGAAVFAQMLLGSWVTGQGAGLAFTDFPLMDGRLLPDLRNSAAQIHFAHRALALVVAALVVATAWRIRATTPNRLARRLALAGAALVGIQVILGAANVWSRLSAPFVVPHLAAGALLWGTSVLLWLAVRRLEPGEVRTASASPTDQVRLADRLRAYLALTKPRIIELLLVTTVPTMVLAERGIPSPWLIAATVIGGSLAAGGANAINQYVDRDIDDVMRRTRHRPIPRHLVPPAHALAFGVFLSVLAFAWLAVSVNLLAAALATSAIGFYVFVYSLWLKRRTPQNIVIGGAAGCVPVLVAWAAVTGEVGIPALVLFAIVFYWTPPHFWALALRYRTDYQTAGVPMLPVVRGEAETARQIVLYSIVLVMVSLLLFPVAGLGLIYLVAAVLLGVVFLGYALRLWRRARDGRAAMALFRYSVSYLTLLFVAVAVDTLVGIRIG
jgi:protoheme IX farnesyltransferase